MAITVCEYAYKLLRPDEANLGINVSNMQVPKSLLAKKDGSSQILKLTAKVNLTRAQLSFSTGNGNDKVEHATCEVIFGPQNEWSSEWQRNTYLIQSRIDWLKKAEVEGQAHKIGRGLAYKLFSALVDYADRYKGMAEVILHSENMEATSKVIFQTTEKDGNFACSPYWIDSVAHISGFIVNGSDIINSQETVYISHGWETFQVAEPFKAENTYRSYVKMQARPGNIFAGDVYVFDDERIIAKVGGLKFQAIPRKVLNMLLPPLDTSKKSVPTTKAAVTAKLMPQTTKKSLPTGPPLVGIKSITSTNKKLAWSLVLDILATEIGVGIEELVDNIAFSDLGVDSLMSLTVSGRIREEIEVDVHSHDFNEYPTIGQFRNYFSTFKTTEFESESSLSSGSSGHDSPLTSDSASEVTTPDEDSLDLDLSRIIRSTIADEMGFEIHEIIDAPDLAALGLDSLMSLSILGSLREQTGLPLSSDFLSINPSVRAIEQKLSAQPQASGKLEEAVKIPSPVAKKLHRTATSVLLQGNSRLAAKYLWIVPDGSGSATSYVSIPDISPSLAVWGLNSPFMKHPEEYNIGVIGMAERFITEMKRRQPIGPYLVAGWSAGGVIAFEIINQLIKAGDPVEQLILIDAPCPDIIEPLPSSLHRWFASIGLLGEEGQDAPSLPAWLLPHFAASVTALSNYKAERIEPSKCPLVTAIWCEDGVCKLPSDPRPDPFPYGHAQFLLDNRIDFGPGLWERYLDEKKIVCEHMPGNHFSMMRGDFVRIPKVSITFPILTIPYRPNCWAIS